MARSVCLLQSDDHQCDIHVFKHLQGCVANDESVEMLRTYTHPTIVMVLVAWTEF